MRKVDEDLYKIDRIANIFRNIKVGANRRIVGEM